MNDNESDPLLSDTDRSRVRSALARSSSFGSINNAGPGNRLELSGQDGGTPTGPGNDGILPEPQTMPAGHASIPDPVATYDSPLWQVATAGSASDTRLTPGTGPNNRMPAPASTDTGSVIGIGSSLNFDASGSVGSGNSSEFGNHGQHGSSRNLMESDDMTMESDGTTILQACVFIEDAIGYRSIHHRIDKSSLKLYRFYYSRIVQWLLYFIIFTLHMLAFLEYPSSLTGTSDLRTQGPRIVLHCGITESIELVCLLVLLLDLIVKSYLKGKSQFLKSKWLWMSGVILTVSLLDWCVSVGSGCSEVVRIRRMLRPFFLLQNSSLMKKTVNCLRKTLPHVVSVLLLLFMHLYFFTLFGMLLFPKDSHSHHNGTNNASKGSESTAYFDDPVESFMSLLVLLTTANNPDVTMPAYNIHRLYAIFFILFLAIGLYCLMNMLTAVIFNQFRGYFSDSIQSSLFRRRLGVLAAFEVLRKRRVALKYSSSFAAMSQGVPYQYVQDTFRQLKIRKDQAEAMQRAINTDGDNGIEPQELDSLPGRLLSYAEFQAVFSILDIDLTKKPRPEIREERRSGLRVLQLICTHRYFNYFGCGVALANVICITLELALEYDHVRNSRNTYLGIVNLIFVAYFCLEQCLKVWGLGWARYAWDKGNLFDGVVTLLLMIVQGVYVTIYGVPFWGKDHVSNRGITLWDLVRVINMLIMIRLLRMVISQIKSMSVVASTLVDLGKNLRAFVGILVVIYYSYALLGMVLFQGVIKYTVNATDANETKTRPTCGSYEELNYWANNFDDFAASLVVLWDVMVVNNWHVFLRAYSKHSSPWSQIYFIIWWLISVVISLNLFTALILENFIMRWDRLTKPSTGRTPGLEESYRADYITVLDLFRPTLQEPSHESLEVELRHHPYFEDVN